MGKFTVSKTGIPGVLVVEPQVFGDSRGYFLETYSQEAMVEAGFPRVNFVQDNESKSKKGVLRGMHFQTSQTQGKLVRVLQGEVFDVAIDLRVGSPSFGKWEGILLTGENKKMFYVPEGLAHGFLVLSEEAVFSYKCTDYYAPQYEGGILWNDPDIGICWPLEGMDTPLLSEKDTRHPVLKNFVSPFVWKGEDQ